MSLLQGIRLAETTRDTYSAAVEMENTEACLVQDIGHTAPCGHTFGASRCIGEIVIGDCFAGLCIDLISLVTRIIDGCYTVPSASADNDQRTHLVPLIVVDAGSLDVPAA